MSTFILHVMVILLVLTEWAIVIWYVVRWDLLRRYLFTKILSWCILVLAVGGIPIIQLAIYRRATGSNPLDDNVAFTSMVVGSVVALAIIVFVAYRKRA